MPLYPSPFATVVAHTSTRFEFSAGGKTLSFIGTDFTYDSAWRPTGGTIAEINYSAIGSSNTLELQETLTDLSGVAIADVGAWMRDVQTARTLISWYPVLGTAWFGAGPNANTVRKWNDDGTFTEVVGTNVSELLLGHDASKAHVTAIRHIASNGTTVIEEVRGLDLNGKALLGGMFDGYASMDFEKLLTAGNSTITDLGATGSAKWLLGGAGDDHLIGIANAQAGGDGFQGSIAIYADALSGVSIDLAAGTVSGPTGNDTLTRIDNVLGSNFADAITGNSHANDIDGQFGADSISGGDGNDRIATYGSATLDGGAGDDTLSGGWGSSISGGAGSDTLMIAHGTATRVSLAITESQNAGDGFLTVRGVENLIGNGNDDTLTGSGVANIIIGGYGADQLFGLGGNDTISGDGRYQGTTATPDADLIDGGDGNDLLFAYAAPEPFSSSLPGGGAPDTLLGGNGNDTLFGSQGGDSLDGGAGSDSLDGGAGADTLVGGDGNDTFAPGSGADSLVGGFGFDTIVMGGATSVDLASVRIVGIEGAIGTDAADQMYGNWAANRLVGGKGADVLTGRGGNDTLEGGDGNDIFIADGGDDLLRGGDGFDTADYYLYSGGFELSLTAATAQPVGSAGQDTLFGFENLTGSYGSDSLTGNGVGNVLRGGAGADTLSGGEGNDTLFGDSWDHAAGKAGSDRIDGGLGADLLYGDGGDDTLLGGAGRDTLIASVGNDVMDGGDGFDVVSYENFTNGLDVTLDRILTQSQVIDPFSEHALGQIEGLVGTSYDDNLSGNAAGNLLQGGAGSDRLNAYAGNDTVLGGDGDDWIEADWGNDSIDGGGGTDTLSFYWSYSGADVSLSITGAQYTHGMGTDEIVGVENLFGSQFGDRFTGDANANLIRGDRGDDSLDGGAGSDTLDGGDGNDTLDGGSGSNKLIGGDGIDMASYASATAGVTIGVYDINQSSIEVLSGSSYGDLILGGEFRNDKLLGQGGNDTILGYGGNDTLVGGDGDDALSSAYGSDLVDGGAGTDRVFLHDAQQWFEGNYRGVVVSLATTGPQRTGAGYDTFISIEDLVGTLGNDTLGGSLGDNSLDGSGGADVLSGGGGADTLTGGLGADVFEISVSGTGVVRITDFNAADDTIRLMGTALPAGPLPQGAFHFGTAAASVSDRIIYDGKTGGLYLDADGSGAGAQVQLAILAGAPALSATDIVIG